MVELSDRAKALLERNKVEQGVADKLDQQIAAAKGNGKQAQASKPKNDAASKLFDALSGRSASQAATETKWEAGSKWGDPTLSDAEFIAKHEAMFSNAPESMKWPPEKAEAFRAAMANGTLKIQKASEVPDLNMHTTVTYNGGSGGVGSGMMRWTEQHPTGATKEALDQGDAFAFWSEDRGDVYVTW